MGGVGEGGGMPVNSIHVKNSQAVNSSSKCEKRCDPPKDSVLTASS